MNWINLSSEVLDSPEFAGAESWELGVWLRLIKYCVRQENGGKILGCQLWTDRMWVMSVGVEKEEIARGSKLWTWATVQSEVLWVHAYPEYQEQKVRQARQAGKLGGSRSTEGKAAAAKRNGLKGGRPYKLNNPRPLHKVVDISTGLGLPPSDDDESKVLEQGQEGSSY